MSKVIRVVTIMVADPCLKVVVLGSKVEDLGSGNLKVEDLNFPMRIKGEDLSFPMMIEAEALNSKY